MVNTAVPSTVPVNSPSRATTEAPGISLVDPVNSAAPPALVVPVQAMSMAGHVFLHRGLTRQGTVQFLAGVLELLFSLLCRDVAGKGLGGIVGHLSGRIGDVGGRGLQVGRD